MISDRIKSLIHIKHGAFFKVDKNKVFVLFYNQSIKESSCS